MDHSPILQAGGKLKVKWRASDANGDSLIYSIDVRKDAWPQWIQIAKEVTATEYEWDPASMPGGKYQVRVTVSDRQTQGQADSLTASKTTPSFVVDRTPPGAVLAAAEPHASTIHVTWALPEDAGRGAQTLVRLRPAGALPDADNQTAVDAVWETLATQAATDGTAYDLQHLKTRTA